MVTNPHVTIVRPTWFVMNRALPPLPWLRTTAGKGPGPLGARMTPFNSYRTPSTVPRNDHGAPAGCRGSPSMTNAPESGIGAAAAPVLGTGECGAHAASENSESGESRTAARDLFMSCLATRDWGRS